MQAYEVVYTYGQTEFKAQLRWMEGVCNEFRHFLLCRCSDDFCIQDEEKWYQPPSIHGESSILTPLQE